MKSVVGDVLMVSCGFVLVFYSKLFLESFLLCFALLFQVVLGSKAVLPIEERKLKSHDKHDASM